MKNVLFASLLVVAAVGIARASEDDVAGPGWMSVAQVTSELHKLGFTDITKIEADDGVWKAKGFVGGQYTKVKLDPFDGRVLEQRRGHHDHDRDLDEDED